MPAELADTLTATEDERLEQAEALVRSYCGWHIAPSRSAETATVRGSDSALLFLPSLYVTEVTSVTRDGTLLAVDTDYVWNSAGILRVLGGGIWGDVDVVVVFTHGHDFPPAEVTAVVQALAQRAISNPGSLLRTQKGPFADTYSQTGSNQSLPIALLDAEKDVLNAYRLVGVS